MVKSSIDWKALSECFSKQTYIFNVVAPRVAEGLVWLRVTAVSLTPQKGFSGTAADTSPRKSVSAARTRTAVT